MTPSCRNQHKDEQFSTDLADIGEGTITETDSRVYYKFSIEF